MKPSKIPMRADQGPSRRFRCADADDTLKSAKSENTNGAIRLPPGHSVVYQVIGYCLKHDAELAILRNGGRAERELWAANEAAWAPDGIRER